MKFLATRTSSPGEKPHPKAKNVKCNYWSIEDWNNCWEIDVKNLDELLGLTDKCSIIIRKNILNPDEYLYELEFYDAYRE